MSEQRAVYRKLVVRIRRALRDDDPGVIRAVDALYRVLGWELGKTKAQVAKDVGLARRQCVEILYGSVDGPLSAPARSDGDDADAGDRGA